MEDKNSKERILDNAKDLFQRYGIRSITMDDIAHNLGISKKTIYQHFSDKDDIVTLAMKQFVAAETDLLQDLKKHAKDALDLLIRINYYMQRNHKQATVSLLFDLQKYHPTAWNIMLEFKYGFVASFIKSNLENGIEHGYFRPDINVDIVTKIRLEEIGMAHNDAVFPRNEYNPVDVSANILDHFVQAITTDRGKKLYKKYKDLTKNNGQFQTNDA